MSCKCLRVSFQDVVEEEATDDTEEKEKEEETSGPDYNYLLSMPMWFLTKEKKDELCKQRDEKVITTWTITNTWALIMAKLDHVVFIFIYLFNDILVIDEWAEYIEEEVSIRSVEGGSRCIYRGAGSKPELS